MTDRLAEGQGEQALLWPGSPICGQAMQCARASNAGCRQALQRQASIAGCATWASRPCDTHSPPIRSSDTAPHVLPMLLYVGPRSYPRPYMLYWVFPAFLSPCPTCNPPPCCCLLPSPFVPPGPSKELIRGRSLVSLCKVCGSLPGLPSAPSSSPPPVTHQALCLRPSKIHLHTCRASKRESAMPASPILGERHLLPAFCQRVAALSSLDFDT